MTSITNQKSTLYRLGVGLMILNHKNDIFVGKRNNTSSHKWQMPQGGIEAGETAIKAAMREMLEEIGSNKCTIIAQATRWYSYDIPQSSTNLWKGLYRGQTQQWFLVRFDGQDDEIDLLSCKKPEFIAWQWLQQTELITHAPRLKKKLYTAIMQEFTPYLN